MKVKLPPVIGNCEGVVEIRGPVPDRILRLIERGGLRQIPGLSCGAVAVPDLKPRAICGASASSVEAPTGLRVHELGLVAPAPLLGTSTVAVPELDRSTIGGSPAGDIRALAQNM